MPTPPSSRKPSKDGSVHEQKITATIENITLETSTGGSVGGNSGKLSVGSSAAKVHSRSTTPKGSIKRPMSSNSNHDNDKEDDEHEYSASFEEISSNNVSIPKSR